MKKFQFTRNIIRCTIRIYKKTAENKFKKLKELLLYILDLTVLGLFAISPLLICGILEIQFHFMQSESNITSVIYVAITAVLQMLTLIIAVESVCSDS